MILYSRIEDAMAALTKEHGLEILNNNNIFIAVLSDYAPNFPVEQKHIRAFVRASGLTVISTAMQKKLGWIDLLPQLCECIVKADIKSDEQRLTMQAIMNYLQQFETRYEAPLSAAFLNEMGMSYYRRFPKEENVPVALLLLEEAWDAGNTESLYYVAASYLKGKGVEQDLNRGVSYLEKAAERHCLRATIEFADRLWKGNGIEKDVQRAISLLKDVDDANAQFTIGEILKENMDYKAAFRYYTRAAQRNQVYAQYAVALSYATGQGIARDMREAKKWLKSAASLGHGDARRKLEELGEQWD